MGDLISKKELEEALMHSNIGRRSLETILEILKGLPTIVIGTNAETILTSTDTYDSDFTMEEIEEQTREHFKQLEEECRKKTAMERIVKLLEENREWTDSTFDEDGYCNDDSFEVVRLDTAIEIVKEEMGEETP